MENYTPETNDFENFEGDRKTTVEIISNKKESKIYWMSIVSFIVGILSYFVCCFGFLPAMLAVIFGVISVIKGHKDAFSITGIILGAVYIILFGLFIGAFFSIGDIFITNPEFDGFHNFDYYF